jgi:hypothetical protein
VGAESDIWDGYCRTLCSRETVSVQVVYIGIAEVMVDKLRSTDGGETVELSYRPRQNKICYALINLFGLFK